MKQAANALNWGVGEMERRYKLMSKLGVRNLSGYNKKLAEAAERGETLPNPFSLTPEQPEPLERLPYHRRRHRRVRRPDDGRGKKIEERSRGSRRRRARPGIHLILATQRPSVDVITGLIKANFPTRIAFPVSSKIDSRTILDQKGAEALLGGRHAVPAVGHRRRCACTAPSSATTRSIAWSTPEEPGRAGLHRGHPRGARRRRGGDALGGEAGSGDGESDPMYDQAVGIVLQHRRASISLVQRQLRIGYNRAARLLEQMEKSGLVSSMSTNGNRDILVPARAE